MLEHLKWIQIINGKKYKIMKLQELINEIISSGEFKNKKGYAIKVEGLTDNTIYGEELEPYGTPPAHPFETATQPVPPCPPPQP